MNFKSKKSEPKLKEWNVPGHYKLLKLKGEGSFGAVAKAIDSRTGREVAIKRIDNVFSDAENCKRTLREIKLMRLLDHEGVNKLIEVFAPDDSLDINEIYLVVELCSSDLK